MELWTPTHAKTVLPAFTAMLVFGWLMKRLLGKKSLQVRMIPLQIITGILLVIEAGKQVLSLCRGYDLYHLPFHFCSLFIFAMPAMAFYRGKRRPQVNAVTTTLCMSVLMLMLIYPNLIYSADNIKAFFTDYFSFHTVFYHNLIMLSVILIFALKLYTPEKGQGKYIIWFMVGFCAVSASMAHILKTNYANFYHCNIPVLEAVRLAVKAACGDVIAQLFYVLAVSVVTVLFVWMFYGLYCGIYKATITKKECRKAKKSKKTVENNAFVLYDKY